MGASSRNSHTDHQYSEKENTMGASSRNSHTDHQYGEEEHVHESMNFFLDAKFFFPVCVFSTERNA
jgi:hypothetical protein